MKNFLRKTTSLLLSGLLSVSLLAVPAGASNALGDDLTQEDTLISESTVLSTNVFWSTAYSDLRRENLITYTPNRFVTPIVTYGSALTSCNTVGTMAKELEAQGYRVVAGMNGDFYNMTTGLPIGLVVADGEVKSSDAGYYAIGFRADGTAVLGKPGITVSADMGYLGYDSTGYGARVIRSIAGINKARVSTSGIYLYTYDFNTKHTTGNTESGVDVVCSIEDGSLSIGGTMTLRVEQVLQASGATAVQPGQIVLSANNKSGSYYVDALANTAVGNTITLTLTAASEEWNEVEYAVGALYSLLENGSVVSGLENGVNPRTAVGQRPDGTLLFYTIDGRQSGLSIGASLTQVAERLLELGCVTALCLDGGGSTTLSVTTPDSTEAAIVNSPSGGVQRAVSNQLFLVSTGEPSGSLSHFYVVPNSRYVLAGSRVFLSVSAVDTHYIPMDHDYDLDADRGTLEANVLTTPADGGEVTVTASSGRKSGSTTVYAVSTPDSISVKNGNSTVTSLTITSGASLALTASAMYNHQPLKADADAFTWTLSGGIGTVDQNGVITASTPGTGTLTVSAGGKSTTVSVTVSNMSLRTLEDFEAEATIFSSHGYGAAFARTSSSEYVRFGRSSGKIDYNLLIDVDTGLDDVSSLPFVPSLISVAPYNRLNFWVYGDGSGNTLSLLYSDGTKSGLKSTVTVLDFLGWKQFSQNLTGIQELEGLEISSGLNKGGGSGTIYVDQLTLSYNDIVDSAVPSIKLTAGGNTLTASISDAVDGVLPRGQVAATLDGKSQSFSYDEKAGILSLPIVSDGKPHRITVLAKDASGNIGRASYDVPVGENWRPLFSDTQTYWAASYVDYLYNAGITTGYADGTFRPNQNITRQQFAVMLFRYLGLEESRYESLAMPFADSSQIADYAKTAVKALYSIGVISGTESGGKLYFNPNGSLTRAQAAAMIGRTQEKGFATTTLTFSDSSSIPSYAAYYIQTMAAQGVLSGYTDGTFKPNASITRGQMAKILYNLL